MPDSLQALPQYKADTKNVIAYEGVIKSSIYPEFKGITPFAQGDGPLWVKGNPPQSMFSVYGSGHVGVFGGTIQQTDVPEILKIDCRATDFYQRENANPTWLFFNPFLAEKVVNINLGTQKVDVYDTVSRAMMQRGVSGNFQFSIPADGARVLVLIPAGTKLSQKNKVLLAGKVPVDYQYGQK